MIFIIEGQPKGKARPRFTRSGHAYTPRETKNYEEAIACAYKVAGGELLDGYVAVSVKAFYKIPKATSKKNTELMEQGYIKPLGKPDIDNVLKVVLDGLNKIAYSDDAQVVSISGEKFYRKEPCIMVEVKQSEQRGKPLLALPDENRELPQHLQGRQDCKN